MAPLLPPAQITDNVGVELNKRGLALRGSKYERLRRLCRAVRDEDDKEVSETGEVKYKREFLPFSRLPLELRKMIWKQAIPLVHRIIRIENTYSSRENAEFGRDWSVSYPQHPALSLMLACAEAKVISYKVLFAKLDPTAIVTNSIEDLAAARANRQKTMSLARQRVLFEEDIFCFPSGAQAFGDPCPLRIESLLSLTRSVLISDYEFNCLIKIRFRDEIKEFWKRSPHLEKLIVLKNGFYDRPAYHSLKPVCKRPILLETLDENNVDGDYTTKFQAWADRRYKGQLAKSSSKIKVYVISIWDTRLRSPAQDQGSRKT
ncbi:hypothetical protein VTL71DRAFT_5777 [Oculimacula yallundae]|uniref:2EXR domain-containing protein n=1 Tax=Oculimacula yallundae TaxID=86028 RepID=A0ABR4BYK9_9HELO